MAHSRLRIALGISMICGGAICLVGTALVALVFWSGPDSGPKTMLIRRLYPLALLGLLGVAAGVRQVLWFGR